MPGSSPPPSAQSDKGTRSLSSSYGPRESAAHVGPAPAALDVCPLVPPHLVVVVAVARRRGGELGGGQEDGARGYISRHLLTKRSEISGGVPAGETRRPLAAAPGPQVCAYALTRVCTSV
jgi:hypothetical protein